MRLTTISFFLVASRLLAQFDTAEVLGTVRDSSGSVISQASVTLVNQGQAYRRRQ